MEKLQLANTVVMARPVHFGFNHETAKDNEFQHASTLSSEVITASALEEFSLMVNKLEEAGLNVLILEDNQDGQVTPDEVFPNNWFFADHRGQVTTFPMLCKSRQKEIRLDSLLPLLESGTSENSNQNQTPLFDVKKVHRLEQEEQGILEGTGAIVFDHQNDIAYGAVSNRCEEQVFTEYCKSLGYQPQLFATHSETNRAIYHTNVMMSVGLGFAVVCEEVIDPKHKEQIMSSLRSNQQVIVISEEQMNHMCGNILHVSTNEGSQKIILSKTAFTHFSATQRAQLLEFGELIVCDIPTIESIGGGSARCMVAEVFLPKAK